jgi:hypothetical protein
MDTNGDRKTYRKLLVRPGHGFSPFLWDGEAGGAVADGAYFYGPEPMSKVLWAEFAGWVRGYSDAVYAEGGIPPSCSWDAFHRTGRALAQRLRDELGRGCEVVYMAPEEDESSELRPN